MTVIMTLAGLFVFFISVFTTDFTVAFRRLLKFVFAGLFIDLTLLVITTQVATFQHFYL